MRAERVLRGEGGCADSRWMRQAHQSVLFQLLFSFGSTFVVRSCPLARRCLMKAFQLGSPGFGEFESAKPSDDVDRARTFRIRSRVSNAARSECISVQVASKDSMRKLCELIFRTDDESRLAATTATTEPTNVMAQTIDTQLMKRRLIERHTGRQGHARSVKLRRNVVN